MEWFVTILIVLPAIVLAFSQSSWLLDYVIIVIAFNRCIRRMVDYYFNGAFNPFSPISLTPLLVAGLLLFPALVHFNRLSDKARRPFYLLIVALIIGFVVGFINNRFAAVYNLAEWLSALAAMAFAATQPVSTATADRWIKTTGWAAVGVAVYGWWQYFTIPPWDAMWLVQSKMVGYLGQPYPTKMTVFSTLNERGPCAIFLSWAAIPMILNSRWRNAGGWASVLLLLSTAFLAGTRSNLIVIAAIALLFPILTKGRGTLNLLLLCLFVVVGVDYGISKIPGSERFTERFGAESLYGQGSSLMNRVDIYQYGLERIATEPWGMGFGSSGLGRRVENNQIATLSDCGYVQIFGEFGWAGGTLFFGALWLLWKELGDRWKAGDLLFGAKGIDPFVPVTRAVLLGTLVFLFVTDIFSGFSLIWVFFGRSLNPYTDPLVIARFRLAKPRRVRNPEETATETVPSDI